MKADEVRAPLSVRIRMYRQGIGDCFLLTFTSAAGTARVLIDCGVHLATTDGPATMRAIAANIRDELGEDGRLDLVVVTHEHWDHLSGFLQAADIFAEMTVDAAWLAWTEDPDDALASVLAAERAERRARLQAALTAWRALGIESSRLTQTESLLGFFGLPAAGNTTEDALAELRRGARSLVYLRPGGAPRALPGVEGARAFVLGPPRDTRLLKKSDPTKKGKEVYEFAAITPDEALFAALAGAPDMAVDPQVVTWSLPFDESRGIPAAEASDRRSAGYAEGFFDRHYYGEAARWRAIDDDWLASLGSLALKLDEDTNNTSLVLAIELEQSGKVLLFPGDAQVGNWLSWADLAWTLEGGEGDSATPVSDDLLRRAVFYKVGHHGSHNATLRERGLEKMDDPGLVAAIPVSATLAERLNWRMPFSALETRLRERTHGRVIRADEGIREAELAPGTLRDDFLSRLTVTDLYIDYTVVDSRP